MGRQMWLVLSLLALLVAGCTFEKVGNLSQTQIEAKLKDIMELSEISLTETGICTYAGTGKGRNGGTFQLKVTKTANKLSWETVDAQGKEGAGEWQTLPGRF